MTNHIHVILPRTWWIIILVQLFCTLTQYYNLEIGKYLRLVGQHSQIVTKCEMSSYWERLWKKSGKFVRSEIIWFLHCVLIFPRVTMTLGQLEFGKVEKKVCGSLHPGMKCNALHVMLYLCELRRSSIHQTFTTYNNCDKSLNGEYFIYYFFYYWLVTWAF